jgi:hypothetical protein
MKMQASLHKEEEAEDGETEDVHRKQMETESDSTKRKGQDAQEKIDRKKKKKTLSLNLAKKSPELHVGESPGLRTFRIFGSADRPRAATSIPQGPETRTFPCT